VLSEGGKGALHPPTKENTKDARPFPLPLSFPLKYVVG